MKTYITKISILIFVILSMGCKSNAQINNENKVSFSKGNCYRQCPVYSLELDFNGETEYNGFQNVLKTGTYHFEIEKETLDHIKTVLKNIDFQNLKDSYNTHIRDMPSTKISYGGQTVIYKGYKDVPQEIKTLSTLFEKILKDKNFIN